MLGFGAPVESFHPTAGETVRFVSPHRRSTAGETVRFVSPARRGTVRAMSRTSVPDGYVSTAELTRIIGVTQPTLGRWAKAGCPCIKVGRGRHWSEEAVRAWMAGVGRTGQRGGDMSLREGRGTDHRVAECSTSGGSAGDLREQKLRAQIRKEIAQANKHELDVAKRRGQLLEREEVERQRVERVAHARAVLIGGPSNLAPDLVDLDAEQIERRLREWVHRALRELAGEDPDA